MVRAASLPCEGRRTFLPRLPPSPANLERLPEAQPPPREKCQSAQSGRGQHDLVHDEDHVSRRTRTCTRHRLIPHAPCCRTPPRQTRVRQTAERSPLHSCDCPQCREDRRLWRDEYSTCDTATLSASLRRPQTSPPDTSMVGTLRRVGARDEASRLRPQKPVAWRPPRARSARPRRWRQPP